jgi:hypothetical protein
LLGSPGARENGKFRRFVTGDENWFTLESHHSTKESIPSDDVTQKAKGRIGTQQFILTVIWGTDGFPVVDLTAEQRCYDTQCFLSNAMEPLLSAIFPDGRKPHSRPLSADSDNCRVYHSKASENFFAENHIV